MSSQCLRNFEDWGSHVVAVSLYPEVFRLFYQDCLPFVYLKQCCEFSEFRKIWIRPKIFFGGD